MQRLGAVHPCRARRAARVSNRAAATDAVIKAAPHVVSVRLVNNRLAPCAIEPRAALGQYQLADDSFTLHTISQNPHGVRSILAGAIFRRPETSIRVIAPDVGGDFGLKSNPHPENRRLRPIAAPGGRRRSDSGQLLSGSLTDYCLPRADDFPSFTLGFEAVPCTNPLGIKGIGEAGAVGSPPAVINAIIDALRPLGVAHIDMPATPRRVWEAIELAPGKQHRDGSNGTD